MKEKAILIGLVLCCISPKSTAQQNLVFNGGFDISTDGIHADGWTTTASGWFNSKNGNPPPDLVLGSPTATTTASQTVTGLTAGSIYLVSGDYYRIATGKIPPEGEQFGVAIDGISYFQTAAPLDFQWRGFTFLWTATSSSALLSLSSGLNGTGTEYMIDNIMMQFVPEPSSCLLCSLGIVLLIFRRRISWPNDDLVEQFAGDEPLPRMSVPG